MLDAKLDLFLLGGFRVTPGVLLYDDNNLTATAAVAGSRSFTLGGVTYYSDPRSPVTGTAALTLNKVAPTLGIGFGNLVPTGNRHFNVTFDLGVVFQGSPQFALGLAGNACFPTPSLCAPVNLVPGLQQNVISEQNKVANDLKPFKYYPEMTFGIGWKF
jgi:hypothetical protein